MLSSHILKAWAGARSAAYQGAHSSIAVAKMFGRAIEPFSNVAVQPLPQRSTRDLQELKEDRVNGLLRTTRAFTSPPCGNITLQYQAASTRAGNEDRRGTIVEAGDSTSSNESRFAQRNSFAGLNGFSLEGGRVRFDDDGESDSSKNYGYGPDGMDASMQSAGTATGKRKRSNYLKRGKFIDKKRILVRGGKGGKRY